MDQTNLTSATATDLAHLLDQGSCSSIEITRAFIERVKTVDDRVHAFLHLDEDDMLAQANASDQRRAKGETLSSLDGIPVGMKDVISVEGQPLTAASKILENYIPNNLIERPKMGFGVPIDSWLRGPLKNWSNDLLNEKKIRDDGYLDFEKVDLIRKEHQSGQNHHHKLWNILMFQSWLDN